MCSKSNINSDDVGAVRESAGIIELLRGGKEAGNRNALTRLTICCRESFLFRVDGKSSENVRIRLCFARAVIIL